METRASNSREVFLKTIGCGEPLMSKFFLIIYILEIIHNNS